MLDSLVRQAYRFIHHPVRDFLNERRFHHLDGEPVYSGIYPTFEAAAQSLPKRAFVGFDNSAATGFYLHHHANLNQHDYPVLYWLGKVYHPGDFIFDYGGGLGQCRYAYQPYLPLTDGSRWVVCDVPAFVKKGQEVATQKGVNDLRFTTDFHAAAEAPIFVSNGALQYVHPDLPELLLALETMPEHVLINRVPVFEGPAYYTVQRTRHRSYAPYRVMNREVLMRAMRSVGYRLEDSWEVQRSLHVNFRPRFDVPCYRGFYFRREIAASRFQEARRA